MRPLGVFLHSARYDRLFAAANLLLTASAMGRPCHLFLFYGALATFLDGSWDEVRIAEGRGSPQWARSLEKAFELSGMPSPTETLRTVAEQEGGLKIHACSTSVRLLGLEPADVQKKVDDIAGLATMLEIVADGEMVYI